MSRLRRPVLSLLAMVASAGAVAALAAAVPPLAAASRSATAAVAGSYVLSATDPTSASYAPTFTGNGYLGVRVAPSGQGYAGGTVPAQSELAGFYARPSGDVQQRADLPVWSTLRFGDGSDTFSLADGTVTGWRQQLDLHSGVITTTARWRASDGHVSDLQYQVFTDRARQYVGVVRLTVTPQWSGTALVTDLVDGQHAPLVSGTTHSHDLAAAEQDETVTAEGTGIAAGLATQVAVTGATATATAISAPDPNSVAQHVRFAVSSGHRYTVTKFVGVASSNERPDPLGSAREQAAAAARIGFATLARENRAAWSQLWADRIDVLGDPTLATQVNASEFYLWSSTREGVDWSVSPAGLSSNGYDGHIFWDAETWMHPSLLALHPELAAAMDAYRYNRLDAARAHAAQTGYRGARFPWESALDGTEQIPPPVSVNSEGLYEMHITADIALAQWQYYLATGDTSWLSSRGWPVLSGAAAFWASKATRGSDGAYHINHVTGPDEENPDVNDEAYTNVAAATTLRIATRAAQVLGRSAPASWQAIADGLVVPVDPSKQIHPEFAGYQGQLVKQADVTMLQYPWAQPMSRTVAQHDLDYYVPRSDPGGPSMSDAINMIDTAALGTPGCASYVYTERSIQPFMRDPFDQFSETRDGGAFTFMTGIGGFLQEFLYGWSGMRFGTRGVTLDPSMNAQLAGVVLHGVAWHGRRFDVSIGQQSTQVVLDSGAALPVTVRGGEHTVRPGVPLTIATRRPDAAPSNNLARCQDLTATSSVPGALPLAAADGSPATQWQPTALPARLTAPLRTAATVDVVTLRWGRLWPPAPAPNVPPPPGPVTTLRPTAYDVLASSDGSTWAVVDRVRDTHTTRDFDVLNFPPVHARYLAVRLLTTADPKNLPMLQELTVVGS